MLTTFDHALRSIDTGVARLDAAGRRIARDGAGGDIARDMVELMHARHEVRVGVTLARTADEMIGTILDVLA